MLKNPPSLKVVLAHGPVHSVDRILNQAIALPQRPKGQMEGLLVSVQISVVEVRIFIEPHRKTQRRPAALLVHRDLAGFKLRLLGAVQSTTSPDRRGFSAVPVLVIGPKNRSGCLEFGRIEQELSTDHRSLVGIQPQDLPKRRVKYRIGFHFPSAQDSRGKLLSDAERINALHAKWGQKILHPGIHFLSA